MERSKLVKLVVAAVIGVAAIVLLAVNFLGGNPRPKAAAAADASPAAQSRGGPVSAPE